MIGDFRQLVSLARAGPTTQDPAGGFVETWIPLDPPTWYCAIQAASARDLERVSGGALTAQATHLIRGRYHPQLTKDCRITYGTRVFDVQSVQDREQRGVLLDVIACELLGVGPTAVLPPQPPAPHAPTHDPGGSDPITLQPPLSHAATHEAGGSDPITGVQGPQGDIGPPGPQGESGLPGPQGDPGVAPPDVVVGPASAPNNAIAVFDGITGKLVKAGADGILAGSLTTLSIAAGVNPSTGGPIRIPNNGSISARNGDNTANVDLLRLDVGNNLQIGTGVNAVGFLADVYLNNKSLKSTAAVETNRLALQETVAPPPPAGDGANLWLQDNGAGKSQLMIQFATGAPIAIATQP